MVYEYAIPGTQAVLCYERDDSGRLLRLSCNGRVYVQAQGSGTARVVGDRLAVMSEVITPHGIWRQVETAAGHWVEEYRWNKAGRLAYVDGVEVQRDSLNRVIACRSDAGEWRYHYAGSDLVRIDSPQGTCSMSRGHQGRPAHLRTPQRVTDMAYDDAGRRCDVAPLPDRFHRDGLGRLWTITDADGAVTATYLWDGFACLGRIDGPPGAPLSAAFSLDPTGTAVRVITPGGVRRVPRDAFGENLLACEGVPGLYGGTVYEGHVYLGPRVIDPYSGSFDSPDPLHGRESDPRRARGYRGSLPVDNPSAGPYAVCQHDPVGRADPTGEFSFWILLSDLTWSLQIHLTGWLAMDMTFNFWGSLITSLFTFPFDVGARDAIGRFFSYEGLYSERVGTWGVRRDGLVGMFQEGRAWTFGHQVWLNANEFDKLKDARVFVPQGAFRPTHYGTLLRAKPNEKYAFLLLGDASLMSQDTPPLQWSRAGGTAEPVVPGSLVPHFPSGGFHFATVQRKMSTPRDCTLTELENSAVLHSGTVTNRVIIDIPSVGLGLTADQLVLLSDTTTTVYIEAVAAAIENGSTRVYLKSDVPGLGPTSVRLRGLGAALSNETINHGAGTPLEYLDAVGTTGAYTRDDPLRLSQGGSPVGAALISRFEAQVQLDAPLTGLTPPITVFSAQALGATANATLAADAQTLDSPSGPPAVNDVLVITAGSGALLAVVVIEVTGTQWRVDRPVQPALGASGAAVTWRKLTSPAAPLGTHAGALEAGAVVTYEAAGPRQAPTANFVKLSDAAGKLAARAVTGLGYDAIVLVTPLPGDTANPYTVERFLPLATPNQDNLTVTRAQALVLEPVLGDDAIALQYYQFGAPQLAATAPTVASVVSSNVAHVAPVPGGLPSLAISQPMGVQPGGGAVVPALVTKVRASVTFDRALTTGAADLEIVPLGAGSPDYNTVVQSAAPLVVTVQPFCTAGGAPNVRVEMPRFGVGEIVHAQGTGVDQTYRVSAVEGATLTLENGAALPSPAPADLTMTRLVPIAPAPQTGSSRIGIAGALAAGTSSQAAFNIWSAGGLAGYVNTPLGVVDQAAGITFPVVLSSVDALDVSFAPLALVTNGAANLMAIPAPALTGTAAGFTRDRGSIVISDSSLQSGPNLILVVPYKTTALTTSGKLTGGSVLVPDDPETDEETRQDSLVTHELTHTLQMARLGPIILMMFPTFIAEGIVEATTDIEMPEFSAYVAGTLERQGGSRFVKISDPQGVPFATDDHVQLTWAASQPGSSGPVTVNVPGSPVTVKLGASPEANKFALVDATSIPLQVVNVQIRRIRASDAWVKVLDIAQQLTLGGIMNQGVGFVWGSVFTLFAHIFYALGRARSGTEAYPATVQGTGDNDHKQLHLDDNAGRQALSHASRVIVHSGDSILVRDVASAASDVLTLTSRVPFNGQVRVANFATHTPESNWDWHDYYPASVPDPSRPTAIQVDPVGDDHLELHPFDEVLLKAGEASQQRTVTAVEASGLVELNKAPSLGDETLFRLAKIGENDPIGNMDNASLIDLWGMGWMRWAFDPYGQLHYRLRPDPGSFWDIVARIGRYAFGSQSWSFMWFSYLTIDRVHQAEYLSQTEQEASENSGDTYTPIGRLRVGLNVVGDIARYWLTPSGGLRDYDQIVISPLYDEPGVHRQHRVTWPAGGGTTDIRNPLRVSPAGGTPGLAVPDVFYTKRVNDPTINALGAPGGFAPSDRGLIPASAQLERSYGMYVAYTSPATHRATVDGNTVDLDKATEAQNKNKQTLWFDSAVTDVAVTIAGQVVNEGDTITLVQKQQVTVSVTPDGARRYAASLLRPTNGTVLTAPDDDNPLVIAAQLTNATEPVEISRFYRFDAAAGTFDDAVLQQHGVHLPADIHIPVRRLSIQVVDTLPVHNAQSVDPVTIVASLSPGQNGFILVPVALGAQGLQLVSATEVATGNAVTLALADLTPGTPAVLDEVRPFIGPDGVVLQISHPAGLAIPGETALALTVEVGAAAPRATLNIALNLVA